ncbi:heterokaryon incompatibility protein-domain-containing protein [Xylariaceae sp. FL1019]|nr:heterokaryon incompatibility protein-domain-containing protein [Xylariaceae sp. FL1019]
MRLLNTRTLELEQFVGEDKPCYAILSHTWGPDEVLFEDIFPSRADKPWANRLGAAKIQGAAELAAKEGFNYIWIDTCCIAKSSSAELSEVINSMFRWYSKSTVCYAYLSDVSINPHNNRNNLKDYDGRWFSEWFRRTWTELIVPEHVQFFDKDWNPLGSRRTLADLLHTITRIDHQLFQDRQTSDITDLLNKHSVHSKMSWASNRKSTRPEDKACSLMGLFNVNMPLLYGEGGQKAFQRLQEAIVKVSNDQSMLLHRGRSWPLASNFVETNITHGKLERKVIKLRRSVSLQTLGSSNLSPYMTNPRLSLQPIINSAPAYDL